MAKKKMAKIKIHSGQFNIEWMNPIKVVNELKNRGLTEEQIIEKVRINSELDYSDCHYESDEPSCVSVVIWSNIYE